MVAQTCNVGSHKTESAGLLSIGGQPGLWSEFRVSQRYLAGPYVKRKKALWITALMGLWWKLNGIISLKT